MSKYKIQKEEINITKYIAQDGQKFESEKSAYLHNCYLLMGNILDNHINYIDVMVKSHFVNFQIKKN